MLPQTFWFSSCINLFSNNLCLSISGCQEQSDVPNHYSSAKISVHLSQSSIYNWYSSLYESLVSMKLITFRLWTRRAFTDPGIHSVCLYSQKESNAFMSWGAGKAKVQRKVQCIYSLSEARGWERNCNFTGTESFPFTQYTTQIWTCNLYFLPKPWNAYILVLVLLKN